MANRYKHSSNTNNERTEVFEATEVLQTFRNFIKDFESERNEKIKLEEELIYLKESNAIYKEKLNSQNNVVVGGGKKKQLDEFINQVANIKMRRCNISEADLINHRNKNPPNFNPRRKTTNI